MHRTHVRLLPALFASALLAGCGDESTTAPSSKLEVSNVANSFAYQNSALSNVSENVVYTWRNDGTSANVNQSPSNLSGAASLVVVDAAGKQVYSRALTENGTFMTTTGTAGSWTVRVNLSNVSGAVNFRLQRP